MSHNTDELVVAGTGDIWVAPVGATLPDDPTADLDAAFVQLGLTTEDGVKLTRTPEIQEFKAWQRRSPVRRELTGEEIMLAFSLEQWNGPNFSFAFGGGSVEETDPGVFRYDFPSDSAQLEEKSLVAEWRDGDKHYRVVCERGNVTDGTEVELVRTALAVLPIGYKALAPNGEDTVSAFLLTDDPAFAEAS